MPSSPTLPKDNDVSAGTQRDPGASRLERPSTNITATIKRVDVMPRIEVYERSESGMKTVGMRLKDLVSRKA